MLCRPVYRLKCGREHYLFAAYVLFDVSHRMTELLPVSDERLNTIKLSLILSASALLETCWELKVLM